MTIRDIQGRLFQPGFIADIPSGNLVWVDPVNGNDAMAVRGRMTVPFKTLGAAKTAASSGDTIMVLPGTYNENNLAKNGVNWHFLPGAVVDYSGTGSALFDTAGGAAAFKVTGHGVFKTTNVSATVRAFSLSNTADEVTAQFDRIETRGQAIYSAGKLNASGNEAKSPASTAVEIRGSAENVLNIHRISSTGGCCVYIVGDNTNCIVRLHAHSIGDSLGYTVFFEAGTTFIDAFEIFTSATGAAVQYACGSNHPLYLRVRRIVNTLNNQGARALFIGSGSSSGYGAIRLYGCSLFSKYGDYAISADSASDVLCPQQCVLKAKSGGTGSSNVTARIHSFLDVTATANVGDL